MATMTARAGALDRTLQDKLQELLVQQEAILRNRKQMLRDSLSTATSGVLDVEEPSVDAEEQGVGYSVLELTFQTIQGIEAALQRVTTGEFGACTECRRRISAARLRALPFAVRCLACQEIHDARAGAGSLRGIGNRPERPAPTHIGSNRE